METRTVKILRIVSLLAIMISLWYLLLAPSLELNDKVKKKFEIQWASLNDDKDRLREVQEVARFDLEKKVYPEIQDRSTKINDWFINKMLFAGGLLGAFLLQLWWPFWRQNGSLPEREQQAVDIFADVLRAAPVCAILGLACVVSLFMDIHIRRSLIVVHQMGVWAAEYGSVALGGSLEQFPTWEQFIRSDKGMHESLIDAVQTGNLSMMTLVLFAFYLWVFQTICLQGLDEFNRLTYGLVITILLVFLLVTHQTSGNFKFVGYGHTFWFSHFWGYFFAWLGITLIMIAWDYVGGRAADPDHRVGHFGPLRILVDTLKSFIRLIYKQ